MAQTLIVSSHAEPVQYPGVHGGSGPPLLWSCFARRGMVWSEIEGFEAARLQPGATIAEHTHSRTDEIYLISEGHGHMTLDGGEPFAVAPGDLVMLPRGHSHGLVNSGDEELVIVVVEFLPGEMADLLPPRAPAMEAV